eukprot:5688570-Amphidinium_carterae.1
MHPGIDYEASAGIGAIPLHFKMASSLPNSNALVSEAHGCVRPLQAIVAAQCSAKVSQQRYEVRAFVSQAFEKAQCAHASQAASAACRRSHRYRHTPKVPDQGPACKGPASHLSKPTGRLAETLHCRCLERGAARDCRRLLRHFQA